MGIFFDSIEEKQTQVMEYAKILLDRKGIKYSELGTSDCLLAVSSADCSLKNAILSYDITDEFGYKIIFELPSDCNIKLPYVKKSDEEISFGIVVRFEIGLVKLDKDTVIKAIAIPVVHSQLSNGVIKDLADIAKIILDRVTSYQGMVNVKCDKCGK